jgi:hypothetical protein
MMTKSSDNHPTFHQYHPIPTHRLALIEPVGSGRSAKYITKGGYA